MANNKEEIVVEKKSNNNLILIVVIFLIVLLLALFGLVTYLLNSSNSETYAQNMNAEPQDSKLQKRSSNFATIGPVYPMDQFIVNLLSESGSRFLKVNMDIEISNDSLINEMNKKKPLIRDIIIRTLSSKTFEEVSTMKGKDKLKEEISNRLNEVLADGYIKNIFFTDFVVQ